MLQNPTSAATSPRPDACHTDVQASVGSLLGARQCRPRSTDRHLLVLLGEHQVLTTGQLVRLAGMPERTVQHRLGVLYQAGLVSRSRPRAAVGTSPYHVWLTAFGAEAVGAGPPEPWSEDPGGVRTVAAMSELWLGLRDHGPAAGLTLAGWRRLPDGFSYRDPQSGADRRLAADAELRVLLGEVNVRVLVFARVHRIPRARLGAALARWAAYLAAPASAKVPTGALVLTRTARQRAQVLDVARGSVGVGDKVAVAAVEPDAVALATEALWQMPADEHDRRLVEVLADLAAARR